MPTLKIAYWSGMGRYLLNKHRAEPDNVELSTKLLHCLEQLIKAIEEEIKL